MSASFQPQNILITGGAGFMYAGLKYDFLSDFCRGSHVANHFVIKYPQYNIVILDKMDYCASLKNLRPAESKPNYKFIRVPANQCLLKLTEPREICWREIWSA